MSTRERVLELIEYVKAGRIPEAIQEFYDDSAVMQENRQPPTVGKAANLVRERGFADSIDQFHEVSAPSVSVDGDQVLIEWIFDYTTRDGDVESYQLSAISYQRCPVGFSSPHRAPLIADN